VTQNPESKIQNPKSPSPLIPHLLVLLAYLGVVSLFTWPLVVNGAQQVINSGDSWWLVWQNWLIRHHLVDLHTSPLVTHLVYWPNGTSLYEESWIEVLFLPLTLLFGPVAAYNLACLIMCVAVAWSMYLLASYLSGNRLAGFVAGFAFVVSCWYVARLWGQLNIGSVVWLLLYIFFLLRREGRLWVNILGAGIMAALTYVSTLYLVLYLVVFTGFWAINRGLDWRVPVRQRLATLGRGLAGGLLGMVLVAPLLVGLLRTVGNGTVVVPEFAQSLTFSADLLGYFVPVPRNLVFGDWVQQAGIRVWGTVDVEQWYFPGWSVWILGIFGLLRAWPQTRLWLNLLLVSFVLSLGPVLHMGGQGYPVPLPYLLLYQLPGLEVGRTPVRFALLVMVALCVGLAYGLADLLGRVRGPARLELLPSARNILDFRVPSPRPLLLIGTLLLIMTAEQLMIPLPVAKAAAPPFYQRLAAMPDTFALLEVPLGDPDASLHQSNYLYYQTLHHKPLVGGYLSRLRDDPFIEGNPLVRAFKDPTSLPTILDQQAGAVGDLAPLVAATRALFQTNAVRYIILHKQQMSAGSLARVDPLAGAVSGAAPVYDDAEIRVYEVTGPAAPTALIVQFDLGWRPEARAAATGAVGRWADQGAELRITTAQPRQLALTMEAAAYGGPRVITLSLEDTPLGTWQMDAAAGTYRLGPFPVPAGSSRLRLVSQTAPSLLPAPTPFDKARTTAILWATRVVISDGAAGR
jgi:hypothetical protein